MSGHNKWSKVKHIKGAADAKRSKLFSKLAKEITVAARDGGGDPDLNARLRQAVTNAKKQSLPGDTIERAIKKGTGEIEGVSYEEACYEGFGAGGIALIVEVITDNKNRSFADLRTLFSKNNGNLGGPNSVSHMFDRKGEIKLSEESSDEEEVMLLAIEAGAEDVVNDDELYYVITANDKLSMVANAISASGAQIESQKLIYVPKTTESVRDLSTARQVLRLFAALDDYDDTQNVYGNFDITEHLMEKIEI
ncbi:MAG: YebC/PmpR family DNA-binding transcriptional regulator [Verrucomicrobiaceae bacterium]|nr:YebC/PmpR family DNA-binding transcriptional regulator [Verrucomicrobiaceae bacterium]NRB45199.1 YebC/PmpR family DNA-binding transcriptional regulator [Verrucomicrobiales bacterium]